VRTVTTVTKSRFPPEPVGRAETPNSGSKATARASGLCRTPHLRGPARALARDVQNLAEEAGTIPHRSDVPTQPCVETEAAPGGMEGEEEHHQAEKDIGPRPLGGASRSIDAEPEMQYEYDRQGADEPHAEPQNERYGEGEFGEENDRIEDVEIGQIDLGHQLAMELERGAFAHLFGPVFQAAGHRQRQLPQHALKPHAAHEHANEPGGEVRSGALGRILLPVSHGDEDAGDDEGQEQRHEQVLPRSKEVVIIGIAYQEIPEIRQRIRHEAYPLLRSQVGRFLATYKRLRGLARSRRAGAESGDDVVAVGREEVPVARPRDPRAGHPAPPA